MDTKKEEIKRLAKKNNVEIELYTSSRYNQYYTLHSDSIKWIDDSIDNINDEDILDYGILDNQDYVRTICANSCYTTDDINDNTMVVVIKKNENKMDKLEDKYYVLLNEDRILLSEDIDSSFYCMIHSIEDLREFCNSHDLDCSETEDIHSYYLNEDKRDNILFLYDKSEFIQNDDYTLSRI